MPLNKIYNFDNYLVSISSDGTSQFNFELSSGESTNSGALKTNKVSINPTGSIVRKVVVWSNDTYAVGI